MVIDYKSDSLLCSGRVVIKGQLWKGFGGTWNDIGSSFGGFY